MKTIRFAIVMLLSLLAVFFICISLLLLIFGDGGNPHSSGVSENVEESKKIGVFIQEYKIDNIQVIDTNYAFPIESAWMEKSWFCDLTKRSKEDRRTPNFISKKESQVVFEFKEVSKKDFLNMRNYFKLWGIHGAATLSSRPAILYDIEDNPDIIQLIIEKFQQPFDEENAIPLFTFDLLRIVDEN